MCVLKDTQTESHTMTRVTYDGVCVKGYLSGMTVRDIRRRCNVGLGGIPPGAVAIVYCGFRGFDEHEVTEDYIMEKGKRLEFIIR